VLTSPRAVAFVWDTQTEPAQIGEKRPREDEATTEAPAAKQATAEAAPTGEPQDDAKRGELLKAVLRQVEFYFSDSNYPKDKFLRTKAAENDDCTDALRSDSSRLM